MSRKEFRYRATKAYQNGEVVKLYDQERFISLRGKLVDTLEKKLIIKSLNYAGIKPPAIIMDLPCGTGRISVFLAQLGFSVQAIDLSRNMVAYTTKRAQELAFDNNITAKVGDAEKINKPNNFVDACVCLRLFGHTPTNNREKILSELSRITKRYAVFAFYHKWCLKNILRKFKRQQKGIEWHPVTFKEIKKELSRAGFEKIKLFPLLLGISETIIVLARKK